MFINRCPFCMEDIGTESVCRHCHKDSAGWRNPSFALQHNSILHGKYLIGSVLGKGGFGITYIGYDLSLNTKVAIKEYFPMSFVSRDETSSIVSWSQKAVRNGMLNNGESFLHEARKMAKVDQLPGMVRVRETFMENATTYIVMDYVQGVNLKNYIAGNGTLAPKICVETLRPIMNSLQELHKRGIIHRDISPDNIMIQDNGDARLLDLGASFDTELQENNDIPVSKRSFSPPEQYSENGNIGPWTDIYALCATIYYSVTGTLVPESISRMETDTLRPIVIKKNSGLAKRLTKVLKKGLALKPEDRYQSVEQLQKALNLLFPTKTSFADSLRESLTVESDIPSDPAGGAVGAFLGSLIGCVLMVFMRGILDMGIGYLGVLFIFCALKGYRIIGGPLDKKGRIISFAMTIVMMIFSDYLAWSVGLYYALKDEYDVTFTGIFHNLFLLLDAANSLGSFWSDAIWSIILSFITLLVIVHRAKKDRKLAELKASAKKEKVRSGIFGKKDTGTGENDHNETNSDFTGNQDNNMETLPLQNASVKLIPETSDIRVNKAENESASMVENESVSMAENESASMAENESASMVENESVSMAEKIFMEDSPKIKYCRNCGSEMEDDWSFCIKCGTKIVG